ncbi:hypothetical protein EDD27_6614 [Nonomuraea polychroma]|uniref:Uncharacterized protein n=1 Tax=Nonomuraea polychroma TaxID=46176 RepID=A0A438MED3_9ACTN|nr:hypothetical protein EDD27_6614 [Nonomuraea polychroma]
MGQQSGVGAALEPYQNTAGVLGRGQGLGEGSELRRDLPVGPGEVVFEADR